MPYRIEIESMPWPFRPAPGGTVERYDRRSGRWVPCPGTPDAAGYPMVSWKPQGGPRRFLRLHQVVWMTYKGPVPDGLEIDHVDGNKQHCTIGNLRLLTHQENIWAARERVGNWTGAKLRPWQVALVLALPEGWRCLHQLADRWGVNKFSLGNIRSKAKRDNDSRYLAGV